MKWHIVAEEGNPKKTGVYLVVLIYNEYVTIDTRWFGNIGDSCDWAYAWLEIPESELPKLPEGLKYKKGDSDGND